MIKDHEVLQNAELLISKRLIIWGAGAEGRRLEERLSEYNSKIEFVDSDEKKQGSYHEIPVYPPERITHYSLEREDFAIIISPDAPDVQESILKQISIMGYQDVDIYTRFAIEGALCFLRNSVLKTEEKKPEIDSKRNAAEQNNLIDAKYELLKRIFMAYMSEKSVYVFQPKKVGSVSLVQSAKAVGIYGVQVHTFSYCFGGEEKYVREIIKKSSGKVITLVREPIARQISLLWHYWGKRGEKFLKEFHSLEELERKFYSPDNENEFEWYNNVFQKVMDINIYDHPFNRDLGYTIIEENGIQVLLLKLEKMNSLKRVIGDFLDEADFELINRNVAEYKNYRYAYQNYLEHVKIPLETWEYYYNGNKYMDYFYSENEKKQFYKRWESHIKD